MGFSGHLLMPYSVPAVALSLVGYKMLVYNQLMHITNKYVYWHSNIC